MKHTFVFVLAAITVLLGYRFVHSTIAQRSGPFAYFANAPQQGTPLKTAMHGVETWLVVGSDAQQVLAKARSIGFECRDPEINRMSEYLSAGCRYRYGFLGDVWTFTLQVDSQMKIRFAKQFLWGPLEI